MYVPHSVCVKMSSKLHSQHKSILIWLLFTMWTSKLRMKHNIMFSISLWFTVFSMLKKKAVKKIMIKEMEEEK